MSLEEEIPPTCIARLSAKIEHKKYDDMDLILSKMIALV
jgi:hypothetical protein